MVDQKIELSQQKSSERFPVNTTIYTLLCHMMCASIVYYGVLCVTLLSGECMLYSREVGTVHDD